ncbi:hypothetical protein II582_05390 [bacterium]|nr:hypothetical protein [bacterium]
MFSVGVCVCSFVQAGVLTGSVGLTSSTGFTVSCGLLFSLFELLFELLFSVLFEELFEELFELFVWFSTLPVFCAELCSVSTGATIHVFSTTTAV